MSEGEYKGIVWVEDVLKDLVSSTLLKLQQDPAKLTRLVKRRSQDDSDEILNYLATHEVLVRLGFAREPWETPQVTITLATDTEADRFLGDELSMRDRELGPEATLDMDVFEEAPTLPFDLAYTDLSGEPFPDAGRVRIDNEIFVYNSNSGSVLRVTGRAATGTARDVHLAGARIAARKLERDVGVHVLTTYRIDVLADNANVVLWLQTLLKVVLLLSQDKLIEEGLSEFKMSSSDYAPRPQFYPQLLYLRTLMLTSRVELSVPQELVEILELEQNPTVTI